MSDIISYLFETNAIKFCEENKPFWYTSGKIGPYFINTHFVYGNENDAKELLSFIDDKLSDKLTLPKNGNIYQYEWFPCEWNTVVESVLRWNNQLIIGDDNGNIKMFGTDYIDEISEEYSEPVKSYFETVPIDFTTTSYNRATKAKTTRAFTLNYIAPETTKFEFGYKTIDEEKVESEEIYKVVNESFDNNLDEYVYLPYGTKLLFDNTVNYTSSGDGFSGSLYGTQTDEIKTYFGFYVKNGIITLGTFSVDITDNSNIKVEVLKEIYNSIDGYKMTSLILKKKLDLLHTIQDELNVVAPNVEASKTDGILIVNPTLNDIPQTINIKEKARKIMFLKFYVESEKYACEFDRFYIEFRMSGKYRGE